MLIGRMMGTEDRIKSHGVCRVCSYHPVLSNCHFIPGGFCLTRSADRDRFSQLSSVSCQKNVFDNYMAIFLSFRTNIIGQIMFNSLCSWSNRVERNKILWPSGVHRRRRGTRGIIPLLQVWGEPLGFLRWPAHSTAITVEEGSFNLPLGTYRPAGKTSADVGNGMSCKVLNSCLSSPISPSRVRDCDFLS